MSLVVHRFGRVEFRILVIVFFRQSQLKQSKKIFEIRQVQIDSAIKDKRHKLRIYEKAKSNEKLVNQKCATPILSWISFKSCISQRMRLNY